MKFSFAFIALIGALALMMIGAIAIPSAFWSWTALVHYIALSAVLLRFMPQAFILLLWFIFIRFTTLISGALIEGGAYMPELLLNGEVTGAFVRLEMLYTLGLTYAAVTINSLVKRIPPMPKQTPDIRLWSLAAFAVIAALCAGAALIGIQHGFPALTGTDRILYRQQVSSRYLSFFLGNRPVMAALLGLIYAVSKGQIRICAGGLFAAIMIISLLFAEKFTSIALILLTFATPILLIGLQKGQRLSRKIIVLAGAIGIITTPAILNAYGVFEDPAAAFKRLEARAASQGQLWYVQDFQTEKWFKFDTERVNHNLKALASPLPESFARNTPYLGARDFMATYFEPSRYKHYIERGVTATMATEGYLLKLFGYVGMLPAYAALLAVYCAMLSYFALAIYSINPVRLLLSAKLLVWANFALNQGYFYLLLGLKPLVLIVAIACFEIAWRLMRARK
ncbi:MAG: DUF6418 domain-containing protein [Pseudomonadota bacterium]